MGATSRILRLFVWSLVIPVISPRTEPRRQRNEDDGQEGFLFLDLEPDCGFKYDSSRRRFEVKSREICHRGNRSIIRNYDFSFPISKFNSSRYFQIDSTLLVPCNFFLCIIRNFSLTLWLALFIYECPLPYSLASLFVYLSATFTQVSLCKSKL